MSNMLHLIWFPFDYLKCIAHALLTIDFFLANFPILLYGVEVWGAYCGFTFENWDKNIIERTHTQFLKRVLGCDIHSPNLMVRAELGKRPILCDLIRKFCFIHKTS